MRRLIEDQSVSGEEAGGRFGTLFRKLEMRAMLGIREKHEPRIRPASSMVSLSGRVATAVTR
ncbi:MAG: hypothetical protein ACREOC_02665 [Gemmatimonadales bacterium]